MAVRNEPSRGSKPDKLMRDALMLALKREAIGADGQPTKRLNKVAEAVVEAAIGGDMAAAKEIFDRIDGKVPQAIAGADDEAAPILIKIVDDWARDRAAAPVAG